MPTPSPPGVRARAAAVAFLALALVAWVDYATGVEVASSIFYFVPIGIVTWWVGPRAGVATAVLSAFAWFANDMLIGQHPYRSAAIGYWNALVRLGVFLVVSTILARLRRTVLAVKAQAEEVGRAYEALDLTRREQLLLKDQILSNVSHELRTPLTALHQFVSLVADGTAGDLNAEQREYLGIAMRNVGLLDRMIGDLLDGSRAEGGKLRLHAGPVVLGGVLDDVMRVFRAPAAEKGVTLDRPAPGALPAVLADEARLRQVIINLIDNAVKFTPKGGLVSVRAQATADGRHAQVSVTDSGPGIPEEARVRVFDRLHQEAGAAAGQSRRGLGLGLYIAREIVERTGGRIWVEGAEGGSTFHFTIPVAGTPSELDEHVGRS
jgi:signal transduction histidine kinase